MWTSNVAAPKTIYLYVAFWATFNFLKWLVGGVVTRERTITRSLFLSHLRLEFVAYSFWAEASKMTSSISVWQISVHGLQVWVFTKSWHQIAHVFAIDRRLSNLHSHCEKVAPGGKSVEGRHLSHFPSPEGRNSLKSWKRLNDGWRLQFEKEGGWLSIYQLTKAMASPRRNAPNTYFHQVFTPAYIPHNILARVLSGSSPRD